MTHALITIPTSDLALTGFYPKLKSFWSCSHMNCCLHYMLHINLHILYIYILKMNLNLKFDAYYSSEGALQPLQVHPTSHT